jgi:hypothetical protein
MLKFGLYILVFLDLTAFFAKNLALLNLSLDSSQSYRLFCFNLTCFALLAVVCLISLARFLFIPEKNTSDRWPLTPPD